jgi:hypothetical protein
MCDKRRLKSRRVTLDAGEDDAEEAASLFLSSPAFKGSGHFLTQVFREYLHAPMLACGSIVIVGAVNDGPLFLTHIDHSAHPN